MSDTISAAEANRKFSTLLGRVRQGKSVVVTSHGKPVARIVPVDNAEDERRSRAARRALLSRLRAAPVVTIGRWTRAELYDE